MKKVSKYKYSPSNSGFTLIELLVVMIILGVLLALGGNSYINSLKKGRDARRKGDLEQVVAALEVYYNDNGSYPPADGSGSLAGFAWGTEFNDPANPSTIYMVKLPTDSSSNFTYYYDSDLGGSYYQLYSRLENELDGDIPTVATVPQQYSGTICVSGLVQACNYGISSSNTLPVDNGHDLEPAP